ncbi:hypothetical protein Q604_UNBc4C00179G0002 [human gut metagenome]|uniref:Uncharacterized protein n=1 Tax=human gut metagenome TaxID=408170 RepID=W1WCK3_9ZZZZ
MFMGIIRVILKKDSILENNLVQTIGSAGESVAAVYKFLTEGFKVFPNEVHYEISKYKESAVGVDVLPALLGVGFICGAKISGYMFAGGVLGWFVILPLISLFGGDIIMYPGTEAISSMGSFALWGSYLKYIGAGAVATGRIISLIKSLPLIVSTFAASLKDLSGKGVEKSQNRTDRDLPINVILI